jgi:hypothetical protein
VNPFISSSSSSHVVYPEANRHIDKLKEPIEITLMGKEELASDTFVYRFALPDTARSLGHDTF